MKCWYQIILREINPHPTRLLAVRAMRICSGKHGFLGWGAD